MKTLLLTNRVAQQARAVILKTVSIVFSSPTVATTGRTNDERMEDQVRAVLGLVPPRSEELLLLEAGNSCRDKAQANRSHELCWTAPNI